MRFVRFNSPAGLAFGLAQSDGVLELQGDMFGTWARTSRVHRWDDVVVEPPVIPGTLYAAGLNYMQHIRDNAAQFGIKPVPPDAPELPLRAPSALVGHGADVIIPADASDSVQYEAELVVVIGKKTRNVTPAQALDHVFGYTIGNDVSERTWQRGDRTFWRGKNTDTFKPMGPWIETDVDLDAMETVVRVNGKEDLRFKTNDMIFSIAHYIAEMTKYLTLYPGDVIWMGTDGTSPDLVHGDVVEVELTGIGVLRNPFVRAQA